MLKNINTIDNLDDFLKSIDFFNNKDNLTKLEAVRLIKKFFNIRYLNELKYYNFDKNKVYDYHVIKRNFEYLSLYINELYLLDIEYPTTYDLSVVKELKNIYDLLYEKILSTEI